MGAAEGNRSTEPGRRGRARGCVLLVLVAGCGLAGWLLYARKKAGPAQEAPQYIVSAKRAETVTYETPAPAEGMPPEQYTFTSPDHVQHVLLVLRFQHLPDSLLDEQGNLRVSDCFLMARGQKRAVEASSFNLARRRSPLPEEGMRQEVDGWFLFSVPRNALEMTLHVDGRPPMPFEVGPAIHRELHIGEHSDSPFL